MLKVSDKFLDAVKATKRTIKLRIKINDKTYTNDDINKFELDSGSMGGNSLGIGSTYANTIKIEFCQVIEGLEETDVVEVFMGIKIAGNDVIPALEHPFRIGTARIGIAQLVTQSNVEYEYVPLGKFYIKGRVDPDRNENKTTVEAMDGWMFMSGLYESKLNYPAPLRSVALEIAYLSNAQINGTSLNAVSSTLIDKPIGYTYRQAMGLVAQIEGKFARFDREGSLEVRALEDPNYMITTNEYFMKGLVKNEVLFRLGGITCKVVQKDEKGNEVTKTLQAGSDKGTQITLENNVMTQVLLDNLYNKIKSINYYPYDLKWRGNPALEAGDWITMADRKGNKFKVPNFNYKLSFSGGLTAVSSADTKPASGVVYKYKGPLTQVIENMEQRIDAAGKNTIYEGLDEPPYPKEGDIWFKPNGPDKEIWIYVQLADGSMGWQKEVSTAPNEELLAELEESAKKAQEAKEAADKAKDLAENAIPKNEPIKSINDSPELIQVIGGKLHITAQTVFDEAIIKTAYLVDASITSAKIGELAVDTAHIKDAAITNAKIKDLNADKINAGTINAANVNITNINASNISSGYLNSSRIQANSITAEKINVRSLSAIAADLGKVTAGTLEAVNINGGIIDSPLFRVPSMETIKESSWDTDHYRTQMKFTKRGLFLLTYAWEYYYMNVPSKQYNIIQIELTVIRSQQAYYEKWTGSGYGSSPETAVPTSGKTIRTNFGSSTSSTMYSPPSEFNYARDMTAN
jgi:hypothetical protein